MTGISKVNLPPGVSGYPRSNPEQQEIRPFLPVVSVPADGGSIRKNGGVYVPVPGCRWYRGGATYCAHSPVAMPVMQHAGNSRSGLPLVSSGAKSGESALNLSPGWSLITAMSNGSTTPSPCGLPTSAPPPPPPPPAAPRSAPDAVRAAGRPAAAAPAPFYFHRTGRTSHPRLSLFHKWDNSPYRSPPPGNISFDGGQPAHLTSAGRPDRATMIFSHSFK